MPGLAKNSFQLHPPDFIEGIAGTAADKRTVEIVGLVNGGG
jgi:hypothetical protein